VLRLRSRLINISEVNEKSALMKLYREWTSVMGRSGARIVYDTTKNMLF
jgi:hypothetical protein